MGFAYCIVDFDMLLQKQQIGGILESEMARFVDKV